MIPLRDTSPSSNYPVVNAALIGMNVLVYLIQSAQGPGLEKFVYVYGLVPARYAVPQISAYFSAGQQLFSLFSFMFLHGGFVHLLGNMWSLYIFGDNVEDRMGHFRYLMFYVLSGIASGLVHLLSNAYSNVPTIGASGAIAGVMGAYFILYPRSRILTLIPIIFIPWFVEIPAFVFIGLWFVLQVLSAAGSSTGGTGIAWWAHIGGFVFGVALLKLFMKMPVSGMDEKLRGKTARKKSPRLQVIRPGIPDQNADLYGDITVTHYEALAGAKKTVNIPWGFQKRLVNVTIPPGVREGTVLRLKGLGKIMPDGQRGDLLLRVELKF